MAIHSASSTAGMSVPAVSSFHGPLGGPSNLLQSDFARRMLAVGACVAAFGWLMAVNGPGLNVRHGSSSLRPEPTMSFQYGPAADGILAAVQAPVSPIGEAVLGVGAASLLTEVAGVSASSEPAMPEPAALHRTATVSASGLRLRDQPTTQGHILETLVGGAVASVLGGVVERNGFQWVPVRVAGDQLGWVATDGLE